MDNDFNTILNRLEAEGNADAGAGMARFGIVGNHVFGVKVPVLRQIAKETWNGRDAVRELQSAAVRERLRG